MENNEFFDIMRGYEVRKRVDKFIDSNIIGKNMGDVQKFVREVDLEIFMRLYNLSHNSKFRKYELKEKIYQN